MNEASESILIYAARYAQGRDTGAALQVVQEILSNWLSLSTETKTQLYKESFMAKHNEYLWILIQARYEKEKAVKSV